MSIFPLVGGTGNPHRVSDYEYPFRILPGRSMDFRNAIGDMIQEANERLRNISLGTDTVTGRDLVAFDYMHIANVKEVLIGPNAGEVRITWEIQGLALLPIGSSSLGLTEEAAAAVDAIGQVVADFDGGLRRDFIDRSVPSNITVLGSINAVSGGHSAAF